MKGRETPARGFPSGTSAAADVIVPDAARAQTVRAELEARTSLVASVSEARIGSPGALLEVVAR